MRGIPWDMILIVSFRTASQWFENSTAGMHEMGSCTYLTPALRYGRSSLIPRLSTAKCGKPGYEAMVGLKMLEL